MGNCYSQCLSALSRVYASRTFTDPIELQRLHDGAGSAGGGRRRERFRSDSRDGDTPGDSVVIDFSEDLPLALDLRAENGDDKFPEVSGCSYDTLCRRFKDALAQERHADICRSGIALAARLYTQAGREAAVEEVLRCALDHCDDMRPYHEYKATRLLAMLYCRLGRQQEAVPLLSLSLDMARSLNDKQNALVLASALSKCYMDEGNFDLSIPLSLAALQSHEAIDFDWESLRPPSPGQSAGSLF
jgi:tetratricopeptide (TPR) repeat protein